MKTNLLQNKLLIREWQFARDDNTLFALNRWRRRVSKRAYLSKLWVLKRNDQKLLEIVLCVCSGTKFSSEKDSYRWNEWYRSIFLFESVWIEVTFSLPGLHSWHTIEMICFRNCPPGTEWYWQSNLNQKLSTPYPGWILFFDFRYDFDVPFAAIK